MTMPADPTFFDASGSYGTARSFLVECLLKTAPSFRETIEVCGNQKVATWNIAGRASKGSIGLEWYKRKLLLPRVVIEMNTPGTKESI